MTLCGHIDLTELALSLRPARRADIAVGLRLAAELIAELPSVPGGFGRLAWIALHDAAVAIDQGSTGKHPLTDLAEQPDDCGSHQACASCTGLPADVINALSQHLLQVRARNRIPTCHRAEASAQSDGHR